MQNEGPQGEFPVTNKMIIAIAAPMTLAFMTTPLLGIVDTTVVGRLGDAAMIGGLAVGAVIFDLLFTTFNFLRTGTTGFVAQALGRGDKREQQAVFWRAVILALGIGGVIVIASPLLRELALGAMSPTPEVRAAAATYITIRFLGSPFSLLNYTLLGMLLGTGRAVSTLFLQVLINGINIALSIWLGLVLGWGIAGVAWATVLGEAIVAIGAFIWVRGGFDPAYAPSRAQVLDRTAFTRLLHVNRDIMIRSFALVTAFFMFTRIGAQFGTDTLAANAILMNFFLLSAYFLDGLSAASEQLAGRAVGANARHAFWAIVRKTSMFGFALSFVAAAAIVLFGGAAIDFMTTVPEVREVARKYLYWTALTSLTGVLAFQMDGVYIGATWSVEMRNMMLLSLAVFLALGYGLTPYFGNHGLWLALNAWLALRGLTLLALVPGKVTKVFAA